MMNCIYKYINIFIKIINKLHIVQENLNSRTFMMLSESCLWAQNLCQLIC